MSLKLRIDKILHRCLIKEGSLEGNTYMVDVEASDLEANVTCENCEEPLAHIDDVIIHIYRELTD